MDRFLIKGGTPLHGEVTISGAKNATLPLMAATLLTAEPCVLRRVPNLSDVHFMAEILESLGATAKFEGHELHLQSAKIKGVGDYELIRKMRGSICILGPLLARTGKALVSMPGGCVIGARPIDLHLKGLKSLGAKIRIESGYIDATARKLTGAELPCWARPTS
jgi:UDP-N-acetylglucosamine 1-carboxyvinyltransferase